MCILIISIHLIPSQILNCNIGLKYVYIYFAARKEKTYAQHGTQLWQKNPWGRESGISKLVYDMLSSLLISH